MPGEWYSPTQPIPVKPAQLSRGHWDPEDIVSAEDTSAEHAKACRDLLDSYGGTFFNAGSFTPFFLHEEGQPIIASINMPHNGGANWGGYAADPAKGIVYINTSEGGRSAGSRSASPAAITAAAPRPRTSSTIAAA